MTGHDQALGDHLTRRLAYVGSSFSGKVKCVIDASMPLNISDLSQPFLMSCEQQINFFSGWWIALYVFIGIVVLILIWLKLFDEDDADKQGQLQEEAEKQASVDRA